MALFGEEMEDEDRDKWIMWFDGTSNALGHVVGAVFVTPNNQCIPFTARLGLDCMNNIAEYKACALGIQAAIDFNVKLLKVYRDLTLVIHQLKGEWETKHHKLISYQAYITNGRCTCYFGIHVSANPAWRLSIHRVQMSQQARTLLLDRRETRR